MSTPSTTLPQDSTPSALALLGPFRSRRAIVALALVLLAVMPGQIGEITRAMMTDAYVQVSAFVAATLLIFYGAERLFHFDMGQALKGSKRWQVPIASLLGATPGCGGAIVVVAAYSSGNVGFGAVVAALTSTMGDAAFLLIATRPDAAAVVLPLSFAVGILSGWIVDALPAIRLQPSAAGCAYVSLIGRIRAKDIAYFGIFLPGIVLGASQLLRLPFYDTLGSLPMIVGLAGTATGLWIWATSPVQAMTNSADAPLTRVAEETSFISVWVIGAYLAYEFTVTYSGLDLAMLFNSVAPFLPIAGVLVGLIPGCGPQVLVTTLFVNGLIPFSALIGNAISNDGDALFPAIALNPKAAIIATLYSTVPAILVAYGFYFLAPGFMN
jgi:hypothetical protein